MKKISFGTGERIFPEKIKTEQEYLLYLKQLFVYNFARVLIPKNGYVLEIGCGEGYGTSLLSENAEKIVGLDVDKGIISHAAGKYETENCVFQLYDGKTIPYDSNFFDAVVSFQVVEHIRDDINFISEICRVLKLGGIFILTTPNKIYRLKQGQTPWNRFHVREYSRQELDSLLRTGFSDIRILGVKGNEEINKIEENRIKQNLKLISLDPLNLRRLMPAPFEAVIVRFLRGMIQRKKCCGNFKERHEIDDFFLVDADIDKSLDLLAIVKKS